MDKNKLKKILFDVACLAVTCDGHIDDEEIRELNEIEKSTVYFKDIDLSRELMGFARNVNEDSSKTHNQCFNQLKTAILNPVQKMLVMEIALRLVYSDTKIDVKEIEFLQSLNSILGIDDETILNRFGMIDFLIDKKHNLSIKDRVDKGSPDSKKLIDIENIYSQFDIKNN